MKYCLIDGNNLAVRAAFANDGLKNSKNIHTGSHYGTLSSLINITNNFQDYRMLIVWDGKSARRMKISQEGVENQVIPSAYKANREEKPEPLLHFIEQSDYIKKGIHTLGIPQIRLDDFEADDVIASYCNHLNAEEIVNITSDKDYYQLLNDHVWIWDGMKQIQITYHDFTSKWGVEPHQWIDIGALSGDTGDNILSIPGWGESTAAKEIGKYGTWQNVINTYDKKYNNLREQFPDIQEDSENSSEFVEKVINAQTPSGKNKYPDVQLGMPYSGVALAVEKKQAKIPKTALMCLLFQERIALAYSLKKMDSDITNLPDIPVLENDQDKFNQYLDFYEMPSLKEQANAAFFA